MMTKTELVSFFIALISGMILIGIIVIIMFLRINTPEKMIAEINQLYQAYDPKYALSVPNDQINDCVEWAFGKDWEKIKWNYRGRVFRDLHPELDPNNFADYTQIQTFYDRVSKAYLNRNTLKGDIEITGCIMFENTNPNSSIEIAQGYCNRP